MRKSLAFLFLLLGLNAYSLPTNTNMVIDTPMTNISFMQKFPLIYTVTDCNRILSVEPTDYDFTRYSVDLRLTNIFDNSFTLIVTPYETSNFLVPSVKVTALRENVTDTFLTPIVLVQTTNPGKQLTKMAPIEDIYNIRNWYWILWVLGGLLLATGIFFLVRHLVAGKKKETDEDPEIWVDPYDEAFSRLRELESYEITNESVKNYFVEISEIVRRFLQRVMRFPALEMSTPEIRRYLKSDNADGELQEMVEFILRLCDRVKYAKHLPAPDQPGEIRKESEDLIEKVRRLNQPAETAPETPEDSHEV